MTTTPVLAGAVVLGHDGSPHSRPALEWAVSHAVTHGRPLLVVHAAGAPSTYETFVGIEENRRELELAGRVVLDQAAVEARNLAPGLRVETRLALGNAHDVLIEAAKGGEVLVVGSRGRGGLASLLLGSVSVDMSAHAPCPVVVVRPQRDRARFGAYLNHVVVGIDGTPASTGALDVAFRIASVEAKPLAVLHSWGSAGIYRDLMNYETRLAVAEEHELQVAEALAGYAEQYPDVRVSQHQEEEDAARSLVLASEDADLVVLGSRGRSDAAAVVFGSVSRYVVEHAGCPVLVVRPAVVPAGHAR